MVQMNSVRGFAADGADLKFAHRQLVAEMMVFIYLPSEHTRFSVVIQ